MQEQWLNHLKVAGFIATGAGVLLWRRNKNTLVNGLEFILLGVIYENSIDGNVCRSVDDNGQCMSG